MNKMIEEMGTSKIWWLSLHPKWAELVKSGIKTMELRKRLPKDMKKGDYIIAYTTLPVGKIEMTWQVDSIVKHRVDGYSLFADEPTLWDMVREKGHCANYPEARDYFGKSKYGYGIQFTLVEGHLDISLSDIKQAGFTPPQGIVNGAELAKHFKLAEHLMIGEIK